MQSVALSARSHFHFQVDVTLSLEELSEVAILHLRNNSLCHKIVKNFALECKFAAVAPYCLSSCVENVCFWVGLLQ